MPAHVSALAVGHLLHEYRIERLLGHGGFGLTYLALDTNLNALVAIKEFLPQEFAVRSANSTVIPKSESDTDSYKWGLERFKDEARALARFKHPNIVRAARLVEANGTAYMVMEFEPGMTLSQFLKRVSPVLDEAQIIGVFLPVLEGLDALHDMELVHRDIKPGNIYLRVRGGPMLIDFGAVRHAIGAHSRSLTAVVTPGYAPIEQYSSEGRQGPWSDLYATGATMYGCMFGHPPTDAAQRSAAISDGGDDPYVTAASIGASRFSPELLEAVDWALKFRVRDRPQSAAAFRDKLAASPQKGKPLAIPMDLEGEPGLQFGAPSDRSKKPVQVPAQELKSAPLAPTSEDSAVMLKAHSGRPKEQDPDKTDIGAVAAALDGKSAPPAAPRSAATEVVKAPKPEAAPKSQPLDFELPPEEPAVPEQGTATELLPKSPILERMGSGIRRAKTTKPLPTPVPAQEPAPQTRSPRTGVPKAAKASPFKDPPRESVGKRPFILIGAALALAALIAGGVWLYQNQRASEQAQYDWAAGVNTVAAYQQYLQTCHLCPHHADAQAAIDQLENADKFTRLKTDFELLLLKKAYAPPAEPNATEVLNELAALRPQDTYVGKARDELAAVLPHASSKPGARAQPVAPPPAVAKTAVPVPAQAASRPTAPAPMPAPAPVPVAAAPEVKVPQPVDTRAPMPAVRPSQPAVTPAMIAAKTQAQLAPQARPASIANPPAQTPVQSAAPAPVVSAPVPAPVPAVPVVKEPQPVDTPAPQYPREAILNGISGWVDVEFTVNTDGSVSDVNVVQAQPVMVFNKSALRAVANWRFTPYTVNGVPETKRIRMRVDFKQ